METILISTCCGAPASENEMESSDPKYAFRWVCGNCKKQCNTEEVCAECEGLGEIITMEPVYPNEPHMADIGSRPCPSCRGGDEDDDYDPEGNYA